MYRSLVFLLLLCVSSGLVAQDQELIQRLDQYATEAVEADNAPAMAILIRHQGKDLVNKAYGTAVVEYDIPADANTIFRLGSITKQFTSAAIMQLVESGKLSLDTKISEVLPDYPAPGNVVTVHQLLNHTSGIPSYTGLGAEFWSKSTMNLTHEELTSMFYDDPLEFVPGTKMSYNNSGYYLLGMIIEAVSEMSYEDYLEENVFKTLGLTNTSYCREKYIIKNRAQGYETKDGQLENDAAIGMNSPYAAGALCSTIGDLAIWNDALHGGKVVSEESFTKMTTKTVLADGSEENYGYGLSLGKNEVGEHISHGGGINGFSTLLSYFKEHDLLVAVLANNGSAKPSNVAKGLAKIALGIEDEEPSTAVTSAGSADSELAKYTGKYQIGPNMTLTMTERDGKLFGKPQDDTEQELVPVSKTEFDVPGVGGKVVFDFDDDDKVTQLTFHNEGQEMVAKKIVSPLLVYTGTYTMMGKSLTMTEEDGKLYGEPEGQSKEQLVQVNKTDFEVPAIDAMAKFTFNDEGHVTKMTLMQGGQEIVAEKVMDEKPGKEKTKAWDYPEAIELDPRTTDRVLGTYEIAPGFSIKVFKTDDGVLMGQGTDQPPFELFAMADSHFFVKEVEATLHFESNEKGVVTGMVLAQNGRDMPGRKVD